MNAFTSEQEYDTPLLANRELEPPSPVGQSLYVDEFSGTSNLQSNACKIARQMKGQTWLIVSSVMSILCPLQYRTCKRSCASSLSDWAWLISNPHDDTTPKLLIAVLRSIASRSVSSDRIPSTRTCQQIIGNLISVLRWNYLARLLQVSHKADGSLTHLLHLLST